MSTEAEQKAAQRELARHAIQSLLHGAAPNGTAPEDCGPWRDAVAAMYDAYADDGRPGARRVYDTCTRNEPALIGLIAGGVTPGDTPRDTGRRGGDTPRFTFLSIAELHQLPPTSWLIDREIPANALTLLYGPSGGGKSFLALDYALRAALADPDHDVVYCAGEGATGYGKRIAAWLQFHQQEAPANFHVVTETPQFMDPAAVAGFIAGMAPLRPALVVVDTLARAMIGGDENSAKDMGLFVAACDQVRRATGAAIVLVHHTGKDGANYRGSSALFAACDAVIELQNDDGQITVSCGKSKDDRPFEPRRLRLVEQTIVGDDDGAPVSSCVIAASAHTAPREDGLSARQRKILEAMHLAVFSQAGTKASELMEMLNIPRKSLYRSLDALLRARLVTQDSKGDPYRLTPAGRAAVGPDFVSSQNTASESPSVTCVTPVSSSVSDTGDAGSVTVSLVSSPYRVTQHDTRHTHPDHDTPIRVARSEALAELLREHDEGGA